ncbi:thiopurine S-methyltransferase [Galenea microaerophila]
MEADFWHKRWQQQQIGFHQQTVNPFLQKYFDQLFLQANDQVLVPLCGKSLDMIWLLEQGMQVLGVELSPLAIEQFLAEQQLSAAEKIVTEHACHYRIEGLELICGDFFQLAAEQCQTVKAVYDRAALIALPQEMRAEYANHLKRIVPKGSRMLLITMNYDPSLLPGPPFAVPESEVEQLFAQVSSLQKLETVEATRKGVSIEESIYLIQF